jgi:phospholipase/carboxylesterase
MRFRQTLESIMTEGIHHITLITRKVQANVDFYVGFLGLRLVKRTGGFEDTAQLHLFYGDALGSPGSLITFLVWEDGSAGRAGIGQIGEIALAIDPGSIGFWLTRALRFGLKPEGPSEEFGEPVLRLKDPDGIILKLVGNGKLQAAAPWAGDGIPPQDAIRRIRGATLFTETPAETQAFVERYFSYRHEATSGTISRLVSQSGDIVDIRDANGFWASAPGTGTADHIAFRAESDEQILSVRTDLQAANSWPTSMHDRKYFRSLYLREPGRILFELATDAPGMLVDEDEAMLGTHLFVPGETPESRAEQTVLLPQFSPPGEPRVIYRELDFVHRFFTPEKPDGRTLILLHGSGGNETTVMTFAHKLDPHATLLGARGRASEEGLPRWFRRFSNFVFDQPDVIAEANAFAAFVEEAIRIYDIDPDRLTFIGYSNGANLINAMLSLHPHLIRRAVLMRSQPALENPPPADMSDAEVLLIAGSEDEFHQRTPALVEQLEKGGAKLQLEVIKQHHGIGDEDIELIRAWLERVES